MPNKSKTLRDLWVKKLANLLWGMNEITSEEAKKTAKLFVDTHIMPKVMGMRKK